MTELQMKTKKILRKMQNYIAIHALGLRALVTLSFAFGLIFMLSLGPQLQQYGVALLNSDATSIYGSVYQETFIKFPTLSSWLNDAFYWPNAAMAIFIAFIVSRQSELRRVLVLAITSSFIALMTLDIATSVSSGLFNWDFAFVNIIANFIGAGLLAFLIVAILIGCDFILKHSPGEPNLRRIFTAFYSIAIGILISTTFFYSAKFLYEPASVKLDVLLDSPVAGAYGNKERNNGAGTLQSKTSSQGNPFDLLRTDWTNGFANWSTVEGQLKTNWQAPVTPEIFDISVSLYSGCDSPESRLKAEPPAVPLHIKDAKTLELFFDEGPASFWTLKEEDTRARFSVRTRHETTEQLSNFWITRDEKTKNLRLSQFVSKNDPIYLEQKDAFGEIGFYLSGPLIAFIKNSAQLAPRKIFLKSDHLNYMIELNAQWPKSFSEKIACRGLSVADAIRSRQLSVPDAVDVGVEIRIVGRPPLDRIYMRTGNTLKVKGGAGWLSLNELSENSFHGIESASVGTLMFKGNIVQMLVDGVAATARPLEQYVAYGNLSGVFEDGGRIRFLGIATSLYKDGARLSPTRWERFGWELRMLLITLVGGIIAFISRAVITSLKNDGVSEWLSSQLK